VLRSRPTISTISFVRPGCNFHDVTPLSTVPHAIWGFNLEDMPISLTVKNVELNAVEDRGSGAPICVENLENVCRVVARACLSQAVKVTFGSVWETVSFTGSRTF
jgi:hypothetical protein